MDSTLIAPYLLRFYLWQVLKANTDMDEKDYTIDPANNDGLVPIVPLAEQPEIKDFGKPYIVYGYSETPPNDLWVRRRGNMAFVVYSTNFRQLSHLVNIITFAFDRADESARDINNYTSTVPAFVGLRFGTVQVSYVEGGSPEESEGGVQSAAINVRYEYYVDYDVKTTPQITYPDPNNPIGGELQGWDYYRVPGATGT